METPAAYETLAAEKYEGQGTYLFNEDSTYVLVQKQDGLTTINPSPLVRFFVYDRAEEKVMYEGSAAGTVAWADAHHLRIVETPGAVRDEEPSSSGYLIDVRTGEKSQAGGKTN